MSFSRLNIQSGGWWVLQFHGTTDPVWGGDYNETNRPINFGARYELVLDSDGIPIFKQVADTRGPVGQWLCWPGVGGVPGHLAQWGQVFPAVITSVSPPKAKPIDTGGLAGWATSTEFLEIAVYLPDGMTATVGMFGLVVVGTELEDQNPLFFPGGSGGGTSVKCFKVTVNNADGSYEGVEYDEPGGTLLGDLAHPTPLKEDNHSIQVPVDQWVRGYPGTSSMDVASSGDTAVPIFWFSMPFGCEDA